MRFVVESSAYWYDALLSYIHSKMCSRWLLFHRILRLTDMGLILLWQRWYMPTPSKCVKLNQEEKKPPRLSIGHLSSAFVILFVGYALSLLVYLTEKILHFSCTLHWS